MQVGFHEVKDTEPLLCYRVFYNKKRAHILMKAPYCQNDQKGESVKETALDTNPPEWAKRMLEHSINKEVYKGNAREPTKSCYLGLGASEI
nr:methyl-CpG-binding domain-containing protein 9-like [Tanacetum cinerariifolium]